MIGDRLMINSCKLNSDEKARIADKVSKVLNQVKELTFSLLTVRKLLLIPLIPLSCQSRTRWVALL